VAKGQIDVSEGQVRLQLTEVDTEAGDLPAAARRVFDNFKSRLTATIRTPNMPYTLTIRSVDTTADGVKVVATAANVQLVS
jgi:hypothetical protein